jgi:hypothetical protein
VVKKMVSEVRTFCHLWLNYGTEPAVDAVKLRPEYIDVLVPEIEYLSCTAV